MNTTVSNRTSRSISLIQVDYPSASFGTQTLAAGNDFKYRFKVLGSGAMKVSFIDYVNSEHRFVGPTLNEGSEGTLAITITDSGVTWQPQLTAKK